MYVDNVKLKQNKIRYGDEEVYVIQPSHFAHMQSDYVEYKSKTSVEDYFRHLEQHALFLPRYEVEENCSFLQIIPYIIIKKEDQYFAYYRHGKSKEPRLLNKYSLGFGGHINPCDAKSTKSIILTGMLREYVEELSVKTKPNTFPIFKGIVRDRSQQLMDHIGLVFVVEVEDAKVLEEEKYKGIWMNKEQLKKQYINFENWAKIIISEKIC